MLKKAETRMASEPVAVRRGNPSKCVKGGPIPSGIVREKRAAGAGLAQKRLGGLSSRRQTTKKSPTRGAGQFWQRRDNVVREIQTNLVLPKAPAERKHRSIGASVGQYASHVGQDTPTLGGMGCTMAQQDEINTADTIRPGQAGLLCMADICQRFRLDYMQVWRAVQCGDVPAVRCGREWRFRAADMRSIAIGLGVDDAADK